MRFFVLAFIFTTALQVPAQARAQQCAQEFDIKNQILKLARDVLKTTARGCEVTTPTEFQSLHGGLSPLWAQDQVGADLAKQFMIDYEKRGGTLANAKIADIDEGFKGEQRAKIKGPLPPTGKEEKAFETHGTQVLNLIGGRGPWGVGYKNEITAYSYNQGLKPAVLAAQNSDVNLVNLEMHALNESTRGTSSPQDRQAKDFRELIPELAKTKIVIAAAGNLHDEDGHIRREDPALKELIIVGSTNEAGFVSDFSESSPDVTILAPADRYLLSPASKAKTQFGQTSGATPIVTGALSNVLNFLPDLTTQEARELLAKTATYLPSLETTKDNGAGLLNAFKLARVAERLKSQGFPANRARLLADPSLFDFQKEAAEELARAKRKLAAKQTSCGQLQEAVRALRKSFLLEANPENSALLASILLASRTPGDAQLYALRSKEALDREVVRARLTSGDPQSESKILNEKISPALLRYNDEGKLVTAPNRAPQVRPQNTFAIDRLSSELLRSQRRCSSGSSIVTNADELCD